jgi:hypothetical protein
MNTRKKVSIIDRTCDRIFDWAAVRLIQSLPIIGPIYTVARKINEHAGEKR